MLEYTCIAAAKKMKVLHFLHLWLLHVSIALPLDEFYPFGNNTTDNNLPKGNTESSMKLIQPPATFPFFGVNQTAVFVNTDGLISFGQPVPQNNSYPFPLSGDTGLQFIAPFFADVDTRGTGVVWCRETRNTTVLNRAGEEIRKTFTNHFSFQPEFVIIATWDSVGYFDSHTDLVNTFQCVLVSDGSLSFAMFLYGKIQWITGDTSGVTGGRGGTPARAEFNAGDGKRIFTLPGSQTASLINITTTSNVGVPGQWIFQINGKDILSPRAPIIVVQTNISQPLNEGETVILVCTAEGVPRPSIQWYKDDVTLKPNDSTNLLQLREAKKLLLEKIYLVRVVIQPGQQLCNLAYSVLVS